MTIPWISQEVYTTTVVLFLMFKNGKDITPNISESTQAPRDIVSNN